MNSFGYMNGWIEFHTESTVLLTSSLGIWFRKFRFGIEYGALDTGSLECPKDSTAIVLSGSDSHAQFRAPIYYFICFYFYEVLPDLWEFFFVNGFMGDLVGECVVWIMGYGLWDTEIWCFMGY